MSLIDPLRPTFHNTQLSEGLGTRLVHWNTPHPMCIVTEQFTLIYVATYYSTNLADYENTTLFQAAPAPAMNPPTLAELVTEVGISPALLDQKCSDADLVSISKDLDWRKTAPHLGLTAIDIDDIDCKKTEPEKRVETLQKWKKKFGFRAKFRMLVEILLESGNADNAEVVCRLLKQQDEGTTAQYNC